MVSAKAVKTCATLIITVIFWVCVLLIYMIVKTYKTIQVALYVSLCLAGTLAVLALYVGLSQAAKYTDITDSFVKSIQKDCCEQYAHSNTISRRKMWKQIKMESRTVQRIKIGYFGELSVDKSFVASLFDNMVDKVVELLILF